MGVVGHPAGGDKRKPEEDPDAVAVQFRRLRKLQSSDQVPVWREDLSKEQIARADMQIRQEKKVKITNAGRHHIEGWFEDTCR